MAPDKGEMLAKSEFPLYVVKSLGERHFLVAGGGGAAKTGINNAIDIYEVKQDGDRLRSASICRHGTGTQAVMNGDSFYDGRRHVFAAGMDDECHIFSMKYKVISSEKEESDKKSEVRKRKGEVLENHNSSTDTKQVTVHVEQTGKIKTDFCKEGAFQKVVKFSWDHSILATGGADGFLRVWKFPELKKLYEIKVHKNEVDDLEFSPIGNRIVTVSKDHTGHAWDTKDGKKRADLVWPQKNSQQYRYRSCRYGLIENQKDKFNLYTISIPVTRSTKPSPCYIALWDSNNFTPKKITSTGTEVLSSLAVSDDGIYLGVGMISGSVAVYISFSLQKLYYVHEAHAIFVTGLDFMPCSEASLAVTGQKEFSLLSISADNTIRVHQVSPRESFSFFWVLVGFVFIVFLGFYLFTENGS
ncbi:hypothetical protein ScPMuIL_007132 [Solemya velum]